MTRRRFRHAECLEDLAALFSLSRDREGRADIACGYCGAGLERVAYKTACSWFVSHDCTSQYEPKLTHAERRLLRQLTAAYMEAKQRTRLERIEQYNLAFTILTIAGPSERPFGRKWRKHMQTYPPDVRFFGGHRIGLREPTRARIKHEQHVDKLLAAILTPNTTATVLAIPNRSASPLARAA